MGELWQKLAAAQVRRPFAIIAVALALGAAALPLVARLELRGDLSALLPDDKPSVVDMHRIQGRFESKSTFTIALTGRTNDDIPTLQRAAREFAERIEAADLREVARSPEPRLRGLAAQVRWAPTSDGLFFLSMAGGSVGTLFYRPLDAQTGRPGPMADPVLTDLRLPQFPWFTPGFFRLCFTGRSVFRTCLRSFSARASPRR